MTNSLNTPVEALEYAYPFRVRRYAYRKDSGGAGLHRGGDGLMREIEFLGPAQVTILSERRRFAPYGLQGGSEGMKGRNVLIENSIETELPGKCNINVRAGSVVRIETPGGGGWGKL
jgi:N-methylhydantoinase B